MMIEQFTIKKSGTSLATICDEFIEIKWACLETLSTATKITAFTLFFSGSSSRKSIESSFHFFFRGGNGLRFSEGFVFKDSLCWEDRRILVYILNVVFYFEPVKSVFQYFQSFLIFLLGTQNRVVTAEQNSLVSAFFWYAEFALQIS